VAVIHFALEIKQNNAFGKRSGNLSMLPDVDWKTCHGPGRMIRNGSYAVWFRTPLREGTGILVFNNGKITGGDTVLGYTGTYFQNGDKFTASVATRRHTPGQPSVFDIDNVDLSVSGYSTPTMASCSGIAKQAPGLPFEATLIPIAD
jgi:hypothetical protein